MPDILIVGANTTATVSTVLPEITAIVQAAITWMTSVVSAVKDEPLLLIGCVLPFIGVGIGLFKRILHI